MFGILKRLFGGSKGSPAPLQPESQYIVRLSDSEVVCERPDGRTDRVAWDELEAFIVETTDDGPWSPDVFWVLAGIAGSGCIIPQGATGEKALLERQPSLLRGAGASKWFSFLIGGVRLFC